MYKKTYKKSVTTKSILTIIRVSSSFRMYTLLSDELILLFVEHITILKNWGEKFLSCHPLTLSVKSVLDKGYFIEVTFLC